MREREKLAVPAGIADNLNAQRHACVFQQRQVYGWRTQNGRVDREYRIPGRVQPNRGSADG